MIIKNFFAVGIFGNSVYAEEENWNPLRDVVKSATNYVTVSPGDNINDFIFVKITFASGFTSLLKTEIRKRIKIAKTYRFENISLQNWSHNSGILLFLKGPYLNK